MWATCGATTRIGLEEFPASIQFAERETVVIQFGANDCNRWQTDRGLPRVSEQAFRANLHEMIDRARRFGARTVVLCTIAPTLKGDDYERDANRYSEAVRRVSVYARCGIYDARVDLRGRAGYVDLIHLDAETHRLYAAGVWEAIKVERRRGGA